MGSEAWVKYALAALPILALPYLWAKEAELERRFREWQEAEQEAKAAHIRYALADGRTAHAVRLMVHGLGTPEWRASVLRGLAR